MTGIVHDSACKLCPLHAGAQTVCIPGRGSKSPRIVIVGEAPGAEEDRLGKPFVGDSGKLLEKILYEVGVPDYWITNTVRCRPPQNRAPGKDEISACLPYLEKELSVLKPEYVITLGATAMKAVLGKAKITQEHGKVFEKNGRKIIPIYHPAYCLRDPSKLPDFKRDWKSVARLLGVGEEEEEAPQELEWEVVTHKTLLKFMRRFEDAPEFSIDLETSGLFPWDGKGSIRCVNIGLPKRAYVIPFDLPFSEFQDRDIQGKILRELLDKAEDKWCVTQNGKFDNHWIWTYTKRRFFINFDTMLAHHILDENNQHDLEAISREELGVSSYDIPLAEKNGTAPWDLFHKGQKEACREMLKRVYKYSAEDACYTLRAGRSLRKKIEADHTQKRLFYRLVMPGARAMGEVESRGLTLDLRRFAEVEKDTLERLTAVKQKLDDSARLTVRKGVSRKVNWNSPAQIGKLLYENLKLPVLVKTDKGAPSTGEAAILALQGRHPVVDNLTEYRELEKFRSTYLDGWKPFMVEDRIYFSYKIHGTVTGRYSSRLHQVPRDGRIRNLATAPKGWVFVQADVSQAELRVAAVASQDQELMKCFRENIDVHWRTLLYMVSIGAAPNYIEPAIDTAKQLEGREKAPNLTEALEILIRRGHDAAIGVWKGWKEARKKAKAVNFGFLYGMYEKKFIETAKLKYQFEPTFEEAHEMREGYFRLYRSLPTWHDRQKRFVKLDGQVRSLSGRIRHLPTIYSSDKMVRMEAERQAINSPIQGFIGDYKVMALIEIHEKLDPKKLMIVGEHHDAILMIAKESCLEETLPVVHRIMKSPSLLKTFKIDLPIPMDSEIEVGPWGAGKVWNPK